jgi:hypothetical protein
MRLIFAPFNPGLNLVGMEVEFEREAFSFLKLHGSVGMWMAVWFGSIFQHQYEYPLEGRQITIDDNLFFAEPPDGQDPNRLKREPLLFFPSQRQYVLSQETGFLFRKFAKAVWNRATEFISNATEIRVIGYSFSGIDQGPILDLLGQAHRCRRIVVQNPDADQICMRLKLERPELRFPPPSHPKVFYSPLRRLPRSATCPLSLVVNARAISRGRPPFSRRPHWPP